MARHRKDSKRRGQNDPGAKLGDPNNVLSASGALVTKKKFARLEAARQRSAMIQREGLRKSRKRRLTPKGKAYKKLTGLISKLTAQLGARRYGSRFYLEPEESLKYFWATIDALIVGGQRRIHWSVVERLVDELETLIWSWGMHWKYGVWRLWLNQGECLKKVIVEPDRRERIEAYIADLPPTPEVDEEYKNMPMTESVS